ncbi:hypothetical protein LUCX_1 [Xanthomonas phage vB_XciM_LucasX]|nr:hypothetical protein LUCX_1 [Xanthomonas phage vB_XciM_LucasX]
MSNATGSPATGYKTESLLNNIIKTKTQEAIKTSASKFVSTSVNTAARSATSTISSAAVNKAVESARSASQQLNGSMGGKLASAIGSGVVSKLAAAATKKVTNLASGATSTVSSLSKNKIGTSLSSMLGGSSAGLLGNTISQVSESGAKNLVAAKIAPGFLENGPTDDLLTTDVYGVSDNNILGNIADGLGSFTADAIDDLRRSQSLVSDLTSMALSGGTNWSVYKDNLSDRIISSLGGRSGLVRGLSDSLKGTIVSGTGLASDIYDSVSVAVASTVGQPSRRTIRSGNVTSAQEVLGLINTITNRTAITETVDIGAVSALTSGVMREAIALGVPDAVSALVDDAQNNEVSYNALLANIQVAIEYSDLDTLQLMINKIGAAGINAHFPNAAADLLAHYELPANTTSEEYLAEWTTLKSVLDALRPGWGNVLRDGSYVNNLAFYSQISDDAKTLLVRQEEHMVASLIGRSYSHAPDMIEELEKMYPLVPLVYNETVT